MPVSPSLRNQPRPLKLRQDHRLLRPLWSGGPLRSSCCHDSPFFPSSPALWPCAVQTCGQRYFEEAKIRKWSDEAFPLFNKFFLSCSPRSAEGPPTSSGPRLLPFMTSSLSTTVSGRGQIFVISRCCCCNAAAALTFRRPLYFMLAIKAGSKGEKETEKKRKSR